jgi:toxin-antitoxin system PIN domain toxin
LPDVNVWLALAVQQHPHQDAALACWQGGAAQRLWFCRVSMLGLVRRLTQPKLMALDARDAVSALAAHDRFAGLPGVGLYSEPIGCDTELRRLTAAGRPARLFTDAYLAAFATSANLRLVSFDRRFTRFAGLQLLRLDLVPTAW